MKLLGTGMRFTVDFLDFLSSYSHTYQEIFHPRRLQTLVSIIPLWLRQVWMFARVTWRELSLSLPDICDLFGGCQIELRLLHQL